MPGLGSARQPGPATALCSATWVSPLVDPLNADSPSLSADNRLSRAQLCFTIRRTPMPFTLPPLPYPADALEAAIDKMTMEIHHGKHHKAYVDNLNAALQGHANLESKPIEQLMRDINS